MRGVYLLRSLHCLRSWQCRKLSRRSLCDS